MAADAAPEPVGFSPPPVGLVLALLGVASAALYVILYPRSAAMPYGPPVGFRLVVYPALFLLYFAAVWLVWWGRDQVGTRAIAALVASAGIVFRGVVLSAPIANNSDTWRYLWEGRVVLEGLNPYAAPPNDRVYDGLRRQLAQAHDPIPQQLVPSLNRVRSVYGPLATGLFVVPHLLPFDRIWSMRLITTLFDLGTVFLLMAVLRALGRAPALALVYAWSPVCVGSFADRAQIDGPMTFFLALAAYLICLRKPGWAGVAFGAALLVKVAPLYLALPFLRLGRKRFGATLVLMALAGAIPFALAGPGSLSGFRDFSRYWQNTDSIFSLLLLALQPLKGFLPPDATARLIVLVAAPVYAVWRTLQGERADLEWLLKACATIATAGILLSPVVHPWYTTHLLAFVVFTPNPGMLLLPLATMSWFMRFWRPPAGSVGGALVEWLKPYPDPWRWVAYPPVYALLIYTWVKERLSRVKPGARPGSGDRAG